MILLKGNSLLRDIFLKLIKTMGENVHWSGIFIINNNDLILFGKGRSLFFNFDTKRVHSTIIDIDLNESAIDPMVKSELLENTLNMTLYAFGKWGQIKGLSVERDYEELNQVLRNMFSEIKVEAVFTEEFMQFYKDGIQMTYEDVIQIIIDKTEKKNEEEISEEEEEEKEEDHKEDTLGLWHKIVWKSNTFIFKKEEVSEDDRNKLRIGKEFYMVKYKCPTCHEKLHMVVFPMGKEIKIETDEAGVYMARAYTCNSCHSFYTPKPGKLLAEGNAYYLDFEEDQTAYDDYLELLGEKGERTSNGNFNMFESEYQKKKIHEQEVEDRADDQDNQEDEDKREFQDDQEDEDKREFQDDREDENDLKDNKIKKSKKSNKSNKSKKDNIKQKAKYDLRDRQPLREVIYKKEKLEENENVLNKESRQNNLASNKDKFEKNDIEKVKDTKANAKIDIKINIGNIQNKSELYSENMVEENGEKKICEKIASLNGKSYGRILKLMEEITNGNFPEMKNTASFNQLNKLLERTGKRELESIISKIPQNLTKSQYNRFKELIEGYEKIDQRPYQKYLNERWNRVEKEEIISFIKREKSKDRKSKLKLHEKLREQGFEEENVAPFLEKIYDEVLTMDRAKIDKICPSIIELSFEEGLEAYEKINLGEFLPELKEDSLSMIDRRLIKIKMDECEQLVYKLSKQLNRYVGENSRFHFNDIRKMIKGDFNDTDSIVIQNALNTYGINKGRYEYPILVCDTSTKEEGKRGFVLTPNHIFYSGIINSGEIDIMEIVRICPDKSLFGKGIFIIKDNGKRIKISNTLKERELLSITKALDEFVGYLQEKPESRKISYLVREDHPLKYCFRCGYKYQKEMVCPRCGSKLNR